MKTTKVKTIGRFTTKTFKTFFFTGSFLILVWIAYCLSLITADWLSWDPDEYEDAKIVLLKC
jgi:hypothetical protein